jgi:DNA polymerase-1
MTDLPRPQIFLVDGYALIYRAFFAMIARPLTTSRGENTSVAWGVANTLIRIFEEYRPEYLAWVHDAGMSFRNETYPEYKATREKLDEELQDVFDRSLDRVEQLLAAFNVRLVAVDGYEADDVIGTLAKLATDAGIHSVIISGDKDFYQLISSHVSLLNPGRRGPAAVQEELVTVDTAANRLGVPPERVVDYLALVGDSSDNVPGVRGVGDKTARKLIAEYGDLDTILSRADEVQAKRVREALLAEADNARVSRELVTIHRDVPVELDIEMVRSQPPDTPALQQLVAELEFHSLMDKVQDARPVERKTDHQVVDCIEDLEPVIAAARRAEIVAVRVEGEQEEARRAMLVGLAIAVEGGRGWYLPFGHRRPDGDLMNDTPPANLPSLSASAMRPLVELLEDAGVPKAGHDIKSSCLTLRSAGVELAGIVYDSMLASFLLDPGKRSQELAPVALEHLGTQVATYADVVGKGKTKRPFAEVPVAEAGRYCCSLSDVVLKLRDVFTPLMKAAELERLLVEIEMPLVGVLVDMEWTGITLAIDPLTELSKQYLEELRVLERSIHEEAGTDFNINSTPQLRHVLFEKLQLPVVKKTKTGPSTDADVLTQLAGMGFAVPRLLIEYRELSKLRSTYLDALPRSVSPATGRIHTRFNQTGAATGRLSSSEPNLQNIPVRTERGGTIRQCFVPASGCRFVVADYSQIELRVLAHLSDDPAFIGAFLRGGDIHRETAAFVFDVPPDDVTAEMRARAKTINFATIYGQGPFALARQLDISQEEAKVFIARYFERFAGVRTFFDSTIERAREVGYVETLFHRRRYIPELGDRNFNIRSFGERTAMNSPIQGSAADLIKIAMINLHRSLQSGAFKSAILLQVHDELVLEAPDDEIDRVVGTVRGAMEGAAKLKVPLVVDIGVGSNWLDAKH